MLLTRVRLLLSFKYSAFHRRCVLFEISRPSSCHSNSSSGAILLLLLVTLNCVRGGDFLVRLVDCGEHCERDTY